MLLKVVVTLWLCAIAYVDARTATIPNWLTLPAIALLGGWRVLSGGWYALSAIFTPLRVSFSSWIQCAVADKRSWSVLLFMTLAWGFCFALWELHVIGGGDAKTLMSLFALFPNIDFAVFLAVAVLVLSLPLLLLKLRRRRPRDFLQTLGKRLEEGSFFPTQRELEEEGRPYAWTFCLPGVIYFWCLW